MQILACREGSDSPRTNKAGKTTTDASANDPGSASAPSVRASINRAKRSPHVKPYAYDACEGPVPRKLLK